MSVNIFSENLEYSLGAHEKFDIELLKSKIIGCIDIQKTPKELDVKGIDYIATLRRGAKINIDAKTRKLGASKHWRYGEPEVALERYSVVPDTLNKGKVGWTLNEASNVDLILYTFDKSDCDKFYLIPFQHLRIAFRKHSQEWRKKYGVMKQPNEQWESEATFVPISVVIKAIEDVMIGNTNNLSLNTQ